MDITHLYESISSSYEEISSFKAMLNELMVSDFNSENPRLFLSLLLKLVNALENHLFFVYLERAKDLENKPLTPENLEKITELERNISLILVIVSKLSKFAEHASAAKSHSAPWGIINQFERVSRTIVSESRIIVSPTWEYNYFYSAIDIDHDLKSLLNKFRASEKELYDVLFSILKDQPRFFNLSYPSIQVDKILQLANWAHELGHFIDNLEGEKVTGKSRRYISSELISQKLQLKFSKEEWSILKKKINSLQKTTPDKVPRDDFEFHREIIMVSASLLIKWAREFFSDYFAFRLFGPAAIFGLCDMTLFYYPDLSESYDEDHPSLIHRIRLLLKDLERWSKLPKEMELSGTKYWFDFLPSDERNAFKSEISLIKNRIQNSSKTRKQYNAEQEMEEAFLRTLINILDKRIDEVAMIIRNHIDESIKRLKNKSLSNDCFLTSSDFIHISEYIDLLKRFIPPNPINQHNDVCLRDIKKLAICLNTGWLHLITRRKKIKTFSERDFQEIKDDRIGIERLVRKSIDSLEAEQWYQTQKTYELNNESRKTNNFRHNEVTIPTMPINGGVLGKTAILQRLSSQSPESSIVITPLLDINLQVDEASIDLRLGNEFITTKHTRLHALDPANQSIGHQISEYQEKYYVPFGYSFVLHPSRFVLGCTLEYVSLPEDVCALVVGRSSWGRLGLIIATASKIDPRFKGVITLELVNLGDIPIFVYPGSRIAQVVLYKVH